MTWEELKIATLQKMFASSATTLETNSTTTPYLNCMPQVANEGLQLLATAGKFIVKSKDITQDGTDIGLVKKHDFSTLVADFYSFGGNKVYLNDGEEYKETTDYKIEGKTLFVLDSDAIGTWTVYYNAYPQTITSATIGTTVLALDSELTAILPLYMASQLYKDDDVSLATQWRNEFEVARSLLNPNNNTMVVLTSEFEGW